MHDGKKKKNKHNMDIIQYCKYNTDIWLYMRYWHRTVRYQQQDGLGSLLTAIFIICDGLGDKFYQIWSSISTVIRKIAKQFLTNLELDDSKIL